jgi:SAM-dependent methyltransferase
MHGSDRLDAGRYAAVGDERFAAGRVDEALAADRQALALSPGFAAARSGLDAILERARTPRPNEQLVQLLLEAYGDEGANWDAVGWGAAHQLMVGWPATAAPEAMAGNALLLEFLKKSLNRDVGLERRLIDLRDATAKRLGEAAPPQPVVDLAAAIAEQAWHNEYVWPDDPRVPDGPAGAMYRPQPTLRPEAVEEETLAAALAEIAPIADPVSRSVAAMYEANPYPRWTHLPRRPKLDVRAMLLRDFPHARSRDLDAPLAVLMPGAGTGQHPLSVASTYESVQVTAVDLSRASLAYGKRMAARYGIGNFEFLKGDILDLPKLGRVFDHVECVGVLHHMADPRAGLMAIASVMKPGAFVRLGLYGEGGRKIVEKARRDIAAARIPSTLDGLRDFRRRVMGGDLKRLSGLAGWEDFWSASLLRDLCFHVQEHRFTIARLRTLLAGSGLTFLGFEFNAGSAHRNVADAGPLAQYRARFRGEPTLSNLLRWEDLEREKPDMFAGYAFVCQKD